MTDSLLGFEILQAKIDVQRERLADLARRQAETARLIGAAMAEVGGCGEPQLRMQCEMCGTTSGVTADADDGCQLCDRCRWIDAHPLQCVECGGAKECKSDETCSECERRFGGE
jgi:hypothetical protein